MQLLKLLLKQFLVNESPLLLDVNNNVVGAVHSSKVIHVLFGSRTEKENKD